MKQLHTRFSEQTDPERVLPEYPRPMLARGSYYNLNGLWEYAVTDGGADSFPAISAGTAVSREELTAAAPAEYDGRILVPFSPECALSGVNRKILPEQVLWYRRKLPSVPLRDGERLLLHFGAVDQHAWIYVNGSYVGEHHGGYLPFACDITNALHIRPDSDADILTVKVIDLTDTSYHSRGKQKLEPSGMYYTAQSGIWQTVWMEAVPENYIKRIAFRPDYDDSKIRMKLYSETDEEVTYTIYAPCIDTDAYRDGAANLQMRSDHHQRSVHTEIPTDHNQHSARGEIPADCNQHSARREIPADRNQRSVRGEIPTDRHQHSVRRETEDIDTEETAFASASAVPTYTTEEPSPQSEILLTGKAVTNHAFSVSLPDFAPWSPEEPYLYYVTFETSRDRVQSYFAMRKCALQSGADGVPRMYLNNRPYFQTGLLDQGYYPESLYTPPTDEAMTADILSAKALGFNMLRKHAKIEPDRFYYHCDRLGMLVWQDMVNGGSTYKDWYVTYLATAMNQLHIRPGDRFRRLLSRREKSGRDEFTAEVRDTVRALGSHPSIVVWVPFNEGWGQFDTLKICSLIKKMDPDRLIDHASGWFDLGGGDIQSIHYYFFRYRFKPERRRAMALTEYGGYSWSVPGHCTHDEEYGYQKYSDSASLTAAFQRLITDTILPSVREGLAAAIYTQLTDIESETNGLYTYDRQLCKMDSETVRECNRRMKEAGSYSP